MLFSPGGEFGLLTQVSVETAGLWSAFLESGIHFDTCRVGLPQRSSAYVEDLVVWKVLFKNLWSVVFIWFHGEIFRASAVCPLYLLRLRLGGGGSFWSKTTHLKLDYQ